MTNFRIFIVTLALCGCQPSGSSHLQPLEVVMAVPDFATSFDSGTEAAVGGLGATPGPMLSVAWAGNHRHLRRPEALAAIRPSLRLTREGVPVLGEVRDDWFDVNGATPERVPSEAFSFVPRAPLEGGAWYVLTMDFTPWIDAGEVVSFPETAFGFSTRTGALVMARFRVDSFPIWAATRILAEAWPPRPGEPVRFLGELSEPSSAWGVTVVQVLYDGHAQDCEVGLGEGGFLAQCIAPPDGVEVEIRLTSDTVHDAAGSNPSRQLILFPPTAPGQDWARPLVLPDFDPTVGT